MATARHIIGLAVPHLTARQQRARATTDDTTAPGLREVLWIWAGLGALAIAVLVTYARFPVSTFYHVSIEGIAGGLSRTLVLLNFPIAIIALALMGFAVARLYAVPDALSAPGRWIVGALALAAVPMMMLTGVAVDQGDLDARPVNAIPAAGALIALGLTVLAVRRTGTGERATRTRGDLIRLGLIGLLAVAALPWIMADLGVYVGDIPLIGEPFMSKQIPPGETIVAVHLGHHHGFDGAIFAAVAIILTRQLGQVRGRLRWPLHLYVALMLVYGLANGLQDFWGEQLVKRGWTDWHVPTVAVPKLTPAWGLIVLGAVILAAVLLLRTRAEEGAEARVAVG